MHRLCTTTFHFKTKPRILWRISTLRRYLRSIWRQFLSCWMCKSSENYRHLPISAAVSSSLPQTTRVTNTGFSGDNVVPVRPHRFDSGRDSSDLVSLKISLLGDSQIGKTSFLKTYAGEEESELTGMNQVDKILYVKGARISYSIWEIGDVGDGSSPDLIPIACKDSVALLFMFDLTSRRTLNSVIRWYQDARKWNPTGIPVLIGTKFDEFVQLPIDLQWTIASEARAYAKALNATLFFSSATYNINVNKIFKFITAKLFDLQWNVERNLNIGPVGEWSGFVFHTANGSSANQDPSMHDTKVRQTCSPHENTQIPSAMISATHSTSDDVPAPVVNESNKLSNSFLNEADERLPTDKSPRFGLSLGESKWANYTLEKHPVTEASQIQGNAVHYSLDTERKAPMTHAIWAAAHGVTRKQSKVRNVSESVRGGHWNSQDNEKLSEKSPDKQLRVMEGQSVHGNALWKPNSWI